MIPLRCQKCHGIIYKKPRSKTPKYCAPCREANKKAYFANNPEGAKRVKGRDHTIYSNFDKNENR